MEKNSLAYLLVLIMTIFGSLGSVLFKKYSSDKKWLVLMLGLSFYGTGSLINIYLLGILPYSTVVISNGLTFIWTILLSYVFFKENINFINMVGAFFISLGLFFIIYY
ncbi:EamA family transporter [Paenibacillus sp. Marseille-Q7038]